nr:MAG TPA: hypothetical protein [Caudoviricetes sp.]
MDEQHRGPQTIKTTTKERPKKMPAPFETPSPPTPT